jgi:hypothetical protein
MSLTQIPNGQDAAEPWLSGQRGEIAPKIFKAIIAAKKEVDAVPKNGATDQRGGAKYDYRKFDDVIDAVAPLMDKHGLLVVPNVVDRHERQVDTKHFVTLTMRYTLYAEDGSSIEASAVGEAFDVGDKASTKAQTVALRIFYCTTFNIPYKDMKDPESGPQHTWPTKPQGTYARLISKLDSVQDVKEFKLFLASSIKMHRIPTLSGETLTTEELEKSIEFFTAAARRLRLSEEVVARIKGDLEAAVAGTVPEAQTETVIDVEPVKFRELMFDFDVAKPDGMDRLVMTTVQSLRSGHLTRPELSELCSKQCPEDSTRGPAAFFLGAIDRCGTPGELSQTVSDINAAMQQKQLGRDVGRSLTNLAQFLIDSKGNSDGSVE